MQIPSYMQAMALMLLFIIGCQSDKEMKDKIIMKTVPYVDLNRFMGDWYVIANIPTFIEKEATNAIESYKLNAAGEIETTFSFYKKSPEGKKKIYTPKGFVFNSETNAEWRMQFLWPIKTPFMIIDLADDYSYTVIGVPSRKYVWIMARDTSLDSVLYENIIQDLSGIGYDISKIQKVPQVWN
jgi:apolipoprotein D and lipocalin family protein